MAQLSYINPYLIFSCTQREVELDGSVIEKSSQMYVERLIHFTWTLCDLRKQFEVFG